MPTLEQEVETARLRFVAHLRWFMEVYPQEAPTKEALAKKLGGGITRSAVSQLLNPHLKRAPDFKTLVAAARLLEFSYDALLRKDPPPVPPKQPK